MNQNPISPSHWWGEFNLDTAQSYIWKIGPLTLVIRSLSGEWQLSYERSSDFVENENDWDVDVSNITPDQLSEFSRYVFRETSDLLTITPMLADRSVVSRPISPFNLTAGEEATLYVSSPLWLALGVGSSSKKLCEIGIQRPSDTWFGTSTREGELCYASSTHCHLNLENITPRSFRAVTPVVIRNQADSTLLIERLNLPAPLLPLYAEEDNRLWTSTVTLIRESDGDIAELIIDQQAPTEAQTAMLLSKPRKASSGNVLIRTFNSVFN